jgi:hypothetical protein
VDETWLYSAAEMERMMKVQDVLLQAMAKKITWWAAAEIIGVTDRMMRRWRERLVEGGYAGLADRRKRKPSAQRSFGTCQGRLPQELRLAGITTVEGANAFLREGYIQEFNDKFSVPAAEKGTAFRRTGRSDLNWVFSVQTERVVAKDNTVAIGDRRWQIDETRFRNTPAGSSVTIHEHLDETVSIRFGPRVVGRYRSEGETLIADDLSAQQPKSVHVTANRPGCKTR